LSVTAASASSERGSVALLYLDIVLVALVAAPALAAGAPALGYAVGATAWIVLRIASDAFDKRLETERDLRRRLGLGVVSSLARVWILACAIMIVGVTASRPDGLTAALVIFGAFSVYFVRKALVHRAQAGSTTR
jgi:hypothetical protein